jgi:hypothetical protein
MFNGEEIVRFQSDLPYASVESLVGRALERLGAVTFLERGEFDVSALRFKSFAADVRIEGELSREKLENEYRVRLLYQVNPSSLCWLIAIVGFFFFFMGPLIFFVPYLAKTSVQRSVEQALQQIKHESR